MAAGIDGSLPSTIFGVKPGAHAPGHRHAARVVEDPYPVGWGRVSRQAQGVAVEVRLAPEVLSAVFRLRPPWAALSLLAAETWRAPAIGSLFLARSPVLEGSITADRTRAGLAVFYFEGTPKPPNGAKVALESWARVATRAASAAGLADGPSWAFGAIRLPAAECSVYRARRREALDAATAGA